MAIGKLQHRRDSTAVRLATTPLDGEFFVDTDTYKVYVGDGSTAGGIEIGTGVAPQLVTVTKTANYTLLTGDSGKDFNNNSASGTVILTLPAAAANLQYAMAVTAAQYFQMLASGSDVINWAGTPSAGGGYIRSNVVGSYLTVKCHGSGLWLASAVEGPWSIDS